MNTNHTRYLSLTQYIDGDETVIKLKIDALIFMGFKYLQEQKLLNDSWVYLDSQQKNYLLFQVYIKLKDTEIGKSPINDFIFLLEILDHDHKIMVTDRNDDPSPDTEFCRQLETKYASLNL